MIINTIKPMGRICKTHILILWKSPNFDKVWRFFKNFNEHIISSVNACVYLSAKILIFFELSKLFIIFLQCLAHALFQVT